MSLESILAVIGAFGFGSVVTALVAHYLAQDKEIAFKTRERKEARYRCILLFMDAFFEPQNLKYLSSRHSDVTTHEDVIGYLKAEYHEMLLYSPKDVVTAVRSFLDSPSRAAFLNAVIEMRKDLWPREGDLSLQDVGLNSARFLNGQVSTSPSESPAAPISRTAKL